MSVLARIMMAFLGYVLACIAAALVLTLGSLAPNWNEVMAPLGPQAGDAESIALWSVTGLAAIIIFSVGFLPSLLGIALAAGLGPRFCRLYRLFRGRSRPQSRSLCRGGNCRRARLLAYCRPPRGDVEMTAWK